jgi:hypothetical protein
MKKNWCFLVSLVLLALFVSACTVVVPHSVFEGGTVIITNNSNKNFSGSVWTDSRELYNGKIHAWDSKSFRVTEEGVVYTDFRSANGSKSNPSGYVSHGSSLVLDL